VLQSGAIVLQLGADTRQWGQTLHHPGTLFYCSLGADRECNVSSASMTGVVVQLKAICVLYSTHCVDR